MMLKINSIDNKFLKRLLEHSIYLSLMIIIIPGAFYFETSIVLPAVVEEWTIAYFIHMFFAVYFLLNVTGNFIYASFTDSSIKGRLIIVNSIDDPNWTFCDVCECMRPPRAWHCEYCDICILKRDHHCTFLACCVGYFNHRYFMLFTFYIFIASVYALIFNVIFLSQFITWQHGLIILRFVLPIVNLFLDYGVESIYIFFFIVNITIMLPSGYLFFYHFNNILKGRIVSETNHGNKKFLYDNGWKSNLVEVFGIRWYLTWVLPFIRSPLPGNGMEWIVEDKCN